jgi:formylglycine-generating enzyme required for sulfatase activity
MNRSEALEVLGLAADATDQQIVAALDKKKQLLQQKMAEAPSAALLAKYAALESKLTEVEQLLSSLIAPSQCHDVATTPLPRSPALSQTKLADLPQSQQSGTGFGAESANSRIQLQPGEVLANRYEIREHLASGGMGAIFRAYDRNRAEDIAIKIMLPALMQHDHARERFLSEARLSSRLSHPNIVNVFDVQQDGDYVFLTMELLQGQDLRHLMKARQLVRQAFDEVEARTLASTLAGALAYAHQHTVHRDIKPENIWVTEEGDYKIMDFGIARVQSTSQRTQTGAAMGTAYYMAPEQFKGTSSIDGRADQYALGVLLYELLSGDVPAGRFKPLREIRKDISKGFAAAVEKALETRAEDRFADMKAFADALQSKSGGGLSPPTLPWKGIGAASAVLGVVASAAFAVVNMTDWLPISQERRLIGKLVDVPGGSFLMGSTESKSEQPVMSVTVNGFRMMEQEVTFAQWDACVAAGGCRHKPDDAGWGRGDRPVVNVSWDDITEDFIPWLNKATGRTYRLPSEAEWEYAARAGAKTSYSWGDDIKCSQAAYKRRGRGDDCSNGGIINIRGTDPVKSFFANQFGLYDMHGNASEWVQDCWSESHAGASRSGVARDAEECSFRVQRGGSWHGTADNVRSASRGGVPASMRISKAGFRLVRDR